jgi:hypothetical protein
MNHRMGQRFVAEHTVSLYVTNRSCMDGQLTGSCLEGQLVNISITGAAIHCTDRKAPSLYAPVIFKLEPKDGIEPEQFCVRGFVVRVQGEMLGLMFMREHLELVRRLRSNYESNVVNLTGPE